MNRQERLEAVYQYLRNTGRVHTQKEFAEKVGYTETSISKAFNGIMSSLTDNLFKAIARTYRPIFSLEWLLTGEGRMLNEVVESKAPNPYNIDPDPDQSGADLLIDMFKSARNEKEKAKEIFRRISKIVEFVNKLQAKQYLKQKVYPLRNPQLFSNIQVLKYIGRKQRQPTFQSRILVTKNHKSKNAF